MNQKSSGSERVEFAPWRDPGALPHVRLDNVTKRFGDFVAVDDLTLDIYEREFFSLLGPSGCGKTTLLRMLAGFERPTSGTIVLGGEDVSGVPPYRRPVNMMFQSYALFPHMSVEKNIAFGLKQDRMPKGEIEARVQEMLGLVQLEKFARRAPHQLSGGQRQRVALARALAKKPKMLLLDEPLGALDRKLREQTQFELMNIQEKLGITFVIVTHDQEEAMTVSSRIAVMEHGRIVQVSTPAEIYEYPVSRYVADFIGDVNILPCKVTGAEDGDIRLATDLARTPVVITQDIAVDKGSDAWVAIRPEKMRIGTEPPDQAGRNWLKGQVWDIGYLGDLSIYHVRLANGTIVKSAQTNQTRLIKRPITWDDEVYLSWPRDGGVVLTG
jgi:putrescine transport system ATP-binding protein